MQQETSNLIAQANEFIEENEELLGDPEVSIHVLQAILIQGAPMATQLAAETRKLMDAAIPPANKLEDAINSKAMPPKEIAVLAAEHKHTKDESEAAYAVLIRFNEFLKKTQDLYEREQEDEQAVAEEMNAFPAVLNGDEEPGVYELPMPLPEKIEIVRDTPKKTPWYNPLSYFFN